MRNLELPGRSPVHALDGMAATSNPLSTMTAVRVLHDGGNAMDAAIAACAVQCVVEPQSTGIGGDCFCLYAPGGRDEVVAFNGSGRAPAAIDVEWFAARGITSIERHTPHAVTIPGAVDAWTQLLGDHGRWDMARVLAPAIGYARDGYPIHQRVASDMARSADVLAMDAAAAAVFLRDGRTLACGERHRQPALAATLERIGREGRDAFYTGRVAEEIVALLRARGGVHTLEDFAGARGEYVTPIRTRYRDHEVLECPPNGQGVIALMLLNVLGGFEAGEHPPLSVERLHRFVEATRLCYHDRNAVLADPAQAYVPVEQMLCDAHADELRAHIDPARALSRLPAVNLPRHHDTVYISVVDRDRNCVSFINTLFNSFGNGWLAPESGVMLHNRGCGFVVDANHPNCIAGNKRPLHTIIPGMLVHEGRAVMPFGVMGGQYQAAGHAWLLSNLLEYGMDVQAAIDFPRLFPEDGKLGVEGTIPTDVVQKLHAMGHRPVPTDSPLGGAQAIHIDWREGVLTGGSEPRKDGCAIGY